MPRPLLAILLVAAASAASAASPSAPARGAAPAARSAPADVRGTYRVKGTARVVARPVIDRDEEVYADAVLAPGRGPRDVSMTLAAEGHRCTLAARLADDGALAVDAGQRCPLKLDGEGARGAIDARLRSGRGRVKDGHLSLELAWDVSGRVSIRTGGGKYEVLGASVDVPAAWAPEVPLDGQAVASVAGWRDESRAGGGER